MVIRVIQDEINIEYSAEHFYNIMWNPQNNYRRVLSEIYGQNFWLFWEKYFKQKFWNREFLITFFDYYKISWKNPSGIYNGTHLRDFIIDIYRHFFVNSLWGNFMIPSTNLYRDLYYYFLIPPGIPATISSKIGTGIPSRISARICIRRFLWEFIKLFQIPPRMPLRVPPQISPGILLSIIRRISPEIPGIPTRNPFMNSSRSSFRYSSKQYFQRFLQELPQVFLQDYLHGFNKDTFWEVLLQEMLQRFIAELRGWYRQQCL